MKRDFKKKYMRTVLGAVWSLLSPLMMLLVMRLVFTQFFGRSMDHYTTYLFIRYFREIVINMTVPPLWFHALMLADTLIAVGIGCFMYKKYNHRFLYYV